MINPRPYQFDAARKTLAAIAANKIPLLAMPTGTGKTVVTALVCIKLLEQGGSPLIVVPFQPLVAQMVQTFARFGITDVGIIWSNNTDVSPTDRIVVAMAQTIEKRGLCGYKPTHIFYDEAHRSAFRKAFEGCPFPTIPITATPYREDGRFNLDDYEYIQPLNISQAIAQGFLCDYDLYCPQMPDDEKLVPLPWLYQQWSMVQRSMSHTLLFGPNVAEVKRSAMYWSKMGSPSLIITDKTPSRPIGWDGIPEAKGIYPKCREDAYKLFRLGYCKILHAVDTISIGFDEPSAECAILIRDSNVAWTTQAIGRVLRLSPGKTRAKIIDCLGATLKVGHPKEISDWRNLPQPSGKACDGCGYVLAPYHDVCPKCFAPVRKGAGNGNGGQGRRERTTLSDFDYSRLTKIA